VTSFAASLLRSISSATSGWLQTGQDTGPQGRALAAHREGPARKAKLDLRRRGRAPIAGAPLPRRKPKIKPGVRDLAHDQQSARRRRRSLREGQSQSSRCQSTLRVRHRPLAMVQTESTPRSMRLQIDS
jgi:hypothetical protein